MSSIPHLDKLWSVTTGCAPEDAPLFNYPTLHPERLDAPLRRRIPTVYGVSFLGDLFDEQVLFAFLAAVYGVMAGATS